MTSEERALKVIAEIGRYSSSGEIKELIERAINEAIKDEREECARIAGELLHPIGKNLRPKYASEIEKEIRAREVSQ